MYEFIVYALFAIAIMVGAIIALTGILVLGVIVLALLERLGADTDKPIL